MIAFNVILQPRFIDGNASLLQGFHLSRIRVHTDNFIAHFGKAGCGHQTHIPCADYRQFHKSVTLLHGFSLMLPKTDQDSLYFCFHPGTAPAIVSFSPLTPE